VEDRPDRPSALSLLRISLVVFVLAWILGPYELRSAIPIWVPFLLALGLELNFLLAALRGNDSPRPDRRPQLVDRERYGYADDASELLVVRDGGEEVWIPYSGETGDELDALITEALEPEEEPSAPVEAVAERRGLLPQLRRFLVGLAVIGALAVVVWLVESRTGWDAIDADTRAEAEMRFADEASRVAEKPVTIRCDESGDYVGVVQHADGVAAVGGDLAYLAPERCLDLYRLAFEGEVRSSQTARAIAVLSHEAWHLRGVRDEGTTECYALQSGVDVGQRLGLSKDRARQMMRQQLTENALRGAASFEYRVPPDCRDGGPLDLKPKDSQFP
jgi:hypothetical protein